MFPPPRNESLSVCCAKILSRLNYPRKRRAVLSRIRPSLRQANVERVDPVLEGLG